MKVTEECVVVDNVFMVVGGVASYDNESVGSIGEPQWW